MNVNTGRPCFLLMQVHSKRGRSSKHPANMKSRERFTFESKRCKIIPKVIPRIYGGIDYDGVERALTWVQRSTVVALQDASHASIIVAVQPSSLHNALQKEESTLEGRHGCRHERYGRHAGENNAGRPDDSLGASPTFELLYTFPQIQ